MKRLRCDNPKTICETAADGYCPAELSRHPLLSAEQLCMRSIDLYASDKRLPFLTKRAWNYIEKGLLTKDENNPAFDTSRNILYLAKDSVEIPSDDIRLDLLIAYLPYFRQRALGKLCPQEQLSYDVGKIFLRTQQEYDQKYMDNVQGAEAEILALYLLSDHAPYPASPREEKNSGEERSERLWPLYNHDIYVLCKKGGAVYKIPLQIKRVGKYDNDYRVPVIALAKVFLQAWQRPKAEQQACYLDVCRAVVSVINNEGNTRNETIVALMKRAMWLRVEQYAPHYRKALAASSEEPV